ncbi:MAG TPA: DUF4157 domain-containing protein, partial [Kofleriaceae bacterium]|nr:DUF4157 domain-containing protein [Kofleriaceae bacterium]
MGFESRHRNDEPSREDLAETLARIHRLELAHSRDVLRRAERAAAEDPQARPVRQWFEILLEDEARAELVGKRTGLEEPAADRAARPREQGKPAPGRETLVMREARHEDDRAREPARGQPKGAPRRLDLATQWRMSEALGFDFSGVAIRPDSPEATGRTRAVVKDGEVHFREGEYRPGTPEGDWLIAHELAHVVQQRGGRGERMGSRRQLEREADRAASLALLGRTAPIALRARPAAAYAFDEGEAHHGGPGAAARANVAEPAARLDARAGQLDHAAQAPANAPGPGAGAG